MLTKVLLWLLFAIIFPLLLIVAVIFYCIGVLVATKSKVAGKLKGFLLFTELKKDSGLLPE